MWSKWSKSKKNSKKYQEKQFNNPREVRETLNFTEKWKQTQKLCKDATQLSKALVETTPQNNTQVRSTKLGVNKKRNKKEMLEIWWTTTVRVLTVISKIFVLATFKQMYWKCVSHYLDDACLMLVHVMSTPNGICMLLCPVQWWNVTKYFYFVTLLK